MSWQEAERKFTDDVVARETLPRTFERLESWAEPRGIDLPDDRTAICRDERIRERVQEEIDRVNEEFEPYERIN